MCIRDRALAVALLQPSQAFAQLLCGTIGRRAGAGQRAKVFQFRCQVLDAIELRDIDREAEGAQFVDVCWGCLLYTSRCV